MPINPFNNDETSFEQGISVNKPVKTLSDQAKQQAKATTQDIVNQLYGVSDSSQNPQENVDQTSQNAQKQAAASAKPKQPVHKLGGMSDAGDHAKYAIMQKQLETGDKKGADKTMQHMMQYFDKTVGTLEEQIKKARQLKQQEDQERKKQEQEEEEQKKQEEEKKNEEVPQATGKGRNRMGQPPGKKPKTDMGLKMGQFKTETFRGSSG